MAYNFADPPVAYQRDADESGAGEYTMATQLVADRTPDYCVVEVDAKLGTRLHVFEKPGGTTSESALRACVLLFHGGGWSGGNPSLFHPTARYLAHRGLVAMAVQYRLYQPTGDVSVYDCLADCRAALAYVRDHAAELGVDPHRVSAMGDSAGGQLALMLGFGSAPANAVISYNPVADLETCQHGIDHVHGPDRLTISPCHAVRDTAVAPAPTLLMHGESDTVCLVDQSRLYAAVAKERWADAAVKAQANAGRAALPAGFCRYIELENTQHAFCLPNYSARPAIVAAAMHEAVLFLGRMGHMSLTAAEATEAAARFDSAVDAAAKL
jgi:acetyl esterase/lipase